MVETPRMSGTGAPHLQRRNGAFHVRLRVPSDVRQRLGMGEVCRSLGSCSYAKAKSLAAISAGRLKEAFVTIATEELDQERARELVRGCFRDLVAETEGYGGYVPATAWPDLEIAEQREMSLERVTQLRSQLENHGFDGVVENIVTQCIDGCGQTVSRPRRLDLMEGVARALIEQQQLFLLRLDDRLRPFEAADPLFRMEAVAVQSTALTGSNITVQSTAPINTAATAPIVGPTVGQAIADYLAYGSQRWIRKTQTARQVHLGYLEEHLGADRPIASITSHDVRAYRDRVQTLRANHGRRRHLSFNERQTENTAHQIATKTAAVIFDSCKAMFAWSANVEGMISTNPAEKVRIAVEKKPKGQRPRRPFTDPELTQLFSSPTFTGSKSRHRRYEPGPRQIRDGKFWIPILSYYSGARAGELVQLLVGDINMDGPIPFFSVDEENHGVEGPDRKHVKTIAGVRKVPLHPDLIALGFLDFVRSRARGKSAARLFLEFPYGCDGQASSTFSKWFGRCMDEVGLPDKQLVFHSLRHGIEDAFRNAKTPQYITDQIVGHSDDATSSEYGVGVSLEVAYEAVCNLKLMSLLPILSGRTSPGDEAS